MLLPLTSGFLIAILTKRPDLWSTYIQSCYTYFWLPHLLIKALITEAVSFSGRPCSSHKMTKESIYSFGCNIKGKKKNNFKMYEYSLMPKIFPRAFAVNWVFL